MTEWYYADRQRQQQGPLQGFELARLFNAGQIDGQTLVWREGLPEWRPLSTFGDELPLDFNQPATRLDPVPGAPAGADGATGTDDTDGIVPVAPATTGAYSPYAAPATITATALGPVLGGEVVMAGFWKRVAANLLDSMIVGVVGGVIGMILGMVAVPLAAMGDSTGFGLVAVQIVIQLVSIAITAAYYAFFHASNSQATLGKMAVGIKVVRTDGSRISLARGIGRYFAMWISALIAGIGFLMAAFTERKQGLHDLICDTLVVDKWAYTDHPEWQRRELGTVTIVVLVLYGLLLALMAVAMIAMVGVLASLK